MTSILWREGRRLVLRGLFWEGIWPDPEAALGCFTSLYRPCPCFGVVRAADLLFCHRVPQARTVRARSPVHTWPAHSGTGQEAPRGFFHEVQDPTLKGPIPAIGLLPNTITLLIWFQHVNLGGPWQPHSSGGWLLEGIPGATASD